MASSGDRFEMPDGSVYVLTRSVTDTSGELVEFEFTLPSGSLAPPPHRHPQQLEQYEVLEGTLAVTLGGKWRTLRAGGRAEVLPGAVHTFRNRSGAAVRVRNVHKPALGFEDWVESVYRLARAGKVRGPRSPSTLIHLSMLWRQFPETLVAVRLRDRAGIVLLAGLGRLLRYTVA
jgi:quercetin dioxygenase-like cupin family protein